MQVSPPNAPDPLIVNYDETNESQISLVMTAFASIAETGGSEIISYSLEWDGGNPGTQFDSFIGEDTNNIQLAFLKDSLTSGIGYNFRYRVKNLYGWSPYSSVLSQLAARQPDAPLAPKTLNTATSVTVSWEEPYNGASAITAYRVELATTINAIAFELEKTYCNAEFDSTVIQNRSCSIPMSVFTEDPFSLFQGEEIIARVVAINSIRESDVSELSSIYLTVGAVV